ncbi:MCE family protein [Mycolicibacterium sp. BK607]|uniref:MCE family protein n=1 Tax=unclassified Mycolicibacterium TaxID=2636767 RepID=UPI002107990D|nr:MCE family protein [Mycolicibacterium sp. BK607]
MHLSPRMFRFVTGVAFAAVLVMIVTIALTAFAGGFTRSVPVTLVAPRAGLVMDPDAKVTMLGVQVGTVQSIEERSDNHAVLHLSIDPSELAKIPANVVADIASTTVFGAKFVQLIPPQEPSARSMYAGQVLQAQQVTVEFNTLFERLAEILGQIEPMKLNEALGVISRSLSGRGAQFGQGLAALDAALAKIEPSLPALSHELSVAPQVLAAYNDAAPDLLKTMANVTAMSRTLTDEQQNFDTLLVSVIGLAGTGNEVLAQNHSTLTDVVHLLLPTSTLLDRYNPVLTCGLKAVAQYDRDSPVGYQSGNPASVNFTLGRERYRYPDDLPKVGATGGPHCEFLPVPHGDTAPFLVADVGANPFKYGNQGVVLNSDGLKQLLFGPIDGPPRNVAQIGQPG